MQKEIAISFIEHHIISVRNHRVLLDSDLAVLYGVETKVLVQSIKRNIMRFPGDFMFQLTNEELTNLRSQFVTSSWGGRRYLPYAFTEQGVAMLSSVLKSPEAIHVNIEIMRAFVRLREMLIEDSELKQKFETLEQKCDKQFKVVFDAIRQLMALKESDQQRSIGFGSWAKDGIK